jgi:tellurite resistance protein
MRTGKIVGPSGKVAAKPVEKVQAVQKRAAGAAEMPNVTAARRAWALHRQEDAQVDEADDAALEQVEATMAAIYYVATADDVDIDEDEYDALVEAMQELLEGEPDEEELEELMTEWDEAIEEDVDTFLEDIAESLSTRELRRTAFELAASVAGSDGELSEDESEALGSLGSFFEMSEREMERLTDRALAALDEEE